jgi:N-acetylmuramoyl-L-alanine amidase
MRSCGSALIAIVVAVAAPGLPAESWSSIGLPRQTATLLAAEAVGPAAAYRQTLQRETKLRGELEAATATPPRVLLTRIRTLVSDYERLSKQFPTSGYSDNALWQAALLAADAFQLFDQTVDRRTARRLLDDLAARFPSSSLVARIPDVRTRLNADVVGAGFSRHAPATAKTATPKTPAARAPVMPAMLTAIQREVLPDAVRVTLLLERETPFSSHRVENPSRLVVDLRDTRVSKTLNETLTYPSGGVRAVRAVAAATSTRLLIDLDRAARYSVYPVYDPYRLIIDVEGNVPRPLLAGSPRGGTTEPPIPGATRVAAADKARTSVAPPPAPSTSAPPTPPVAQRGTVSDSGRPPASARTSSSRTSLSRQLGLGATRIVIDAGHGGHDPGAQSPGLDESALVLDVALRLEQLLLKTPGVEVIMTRRRNEYLPLEERTAIANRANADLFVSIHGNASPNPSARGIETYFLNFAPNADAEAIATRENAGSGRTMHNLQDMVRAITLNDKVDESRELAMNVQSALYRNLRKTNKQAKSLGVKQAPFQVLIGATMPSVLAEISFITNEQEGDLLKTDKYRDQIAAALYDGVIDYRRSLNATKAVATKGAD